MLLQALSFENITLDFRLNSIFHIYSVGFVTRSQILISSFLNLLFWFPDLQFYCRISNCGFRIYSYKFRICNSEPAFQIPSSLQFLTQNCQLGVLGLQLATPKFSFRFKIYYFQISIYNFGIQIANSRLTTPTCSDLLLQIIDLQLKLGFSFCNSKYAFQTPYLVFTTTRDFRFVTMIPAFKLQFSDLLLQVSDLQFRARISNL